MLKVGVGTLKRKGNVDHLVVHWVTSQPAPQVTLDMLAGNCTKKFAKHRCVCMLNGLKCTDMCKLKDCDNQADDDDSINGFQEEYKIRLLLVTYFNLKVMILHF